MSHRFRTSSKRVCAIVDTDLTDPQVQAFILTANLLVTQELGTTDKLTDAMKAEIEAYLAAHFITLRDQRTMKEEADGVRFTFEGKTGQGLDGSKYGQAAQDLDTTGALRSIGQEDGVAWIARAGSERTNLTASDNLPTV